MLITPVLPVPGGPCTSFALSEEIESYVASPFEGFVLLGVERLETR